MNACDFIDYLGYSSIYPAFDLFLSEKGIKWRPNLKNDLDTMHFIRGTGIVISFTASAENEGIKIKSDGNFIFQDLTMTIIEEDKKDGKYTGQLPKGILQSDSREQIETKLGSPKKRHAEMDHYFLDDLIWIVAFEENKFQFLTLQVPNNIWRKHGVCP